jgi:hypothetical protein
MDVTSYSHSCALSVVLKATLGDGMADTAEASGGVSVADEAVDERCPFEVAVATCFSSSSRR